MSENTVPAACFSGLSCSAELFAHGIAAHRAALEHLDTHYMDGALVGINVSAQLHVMSFVALELFGIHHIPALAVFVVDEGVFIAVRFDRALQRHQWSFRPSLIGLGLRHVVVLLSEGG